MRKVCIKGCHVLNEAAEALSERNIQRISEHRHVLMIRTVNLFEHFLDEGDGEIVPVIFEGELYRGKDEEECFEPKRIVL